MRSTKKSLIVFHLLITRCSNEHEVCPVPPYEVAYGRTTLRIAQIISNREVNYRYPYSDIDKDAEPVRQHMPKCC